MCVYHKNKLIFKCTKIVIAIDTHGIMTLLFINTFQRIHFFSFLCFLFYCFIKNVTSHLNYDQSLMIARVDKVIIISDTM